MPRKQIATLGGTSGRLPPVAPARRRREKGQALVLAVVCMVVFVVGVLVLFNTGQVVNKKVQLNNTADAAAYSAAVQQARTYNVIAYLNRAQVANEIATAQIVSIHSWMNFAISATDHFAKAVQGIGIALDLTVVGAELGAALNEAGVELSQLKSALQELRDVLKPVFTVAVAGLSTVDVVYAKAAQGIVGVEVGDIPSVVQTVINQNTITAAGSTDKQARLSTKSLALLGSQALTANTSYARLYSVPTSATSSSNPRRTPDADRYASVVMEARDGFSASRDGDLFFMHKRGGTDLVSYNRWVGLDTLNATLSTPWPLPDVNVPFAWGGAAAAKDSTPSFSNLANPNPGWTSLYDNDRGRHAPYGGAGSNGASSGLAYRQPATPNSTAAILTGYRGLQSYEDIRAGKAVAPYSNNNTPDVGPIFSVLVEQPMTDVRTSSNVQGIGGPPALVAPDSAQNAQMTALASAQVYFDRPRNLLGFRRADDHRELGNLFSPYWQARLVDTPTSVKVEIFGADAVGL